MKTLILSLALVLSLNSRPSHALVGLITVSPSVIIAGLVVGGVGTFIAGNVHSTNPISAVASIVVFAISGSVILDQNTLTYSEINPQDAEKLGLTEEEASSYNQNLDQINSMVGYVDSSLSEISNPTAQDSAQAWSAVKDSIPAEAFSALVKISSQIK